MNKVPKSWGLQWKTRLALVGFMRACLSVVSSMRCVALGEGMGVGEFRESETLRGATAGNGGPISKRKGEDEDDLVM